MSGPNEPAPGTAARPVRIGIVGGGGIAVDAGAIDTLGGRARIVAATDIAVWNLEGAQ